MRDGVELYLHNDHNNISQGMGTNLGQKRGDAFLLLWMAAVQILWLLFALL